jgi:glyoxylate/succinic semialdehyde reductase
MNVYVPLHACMYIGDKELYERAKADLDAMGKASFYFGAVGSGTKMKLTVNMTMGAMMTCLVSVY